MLTTKKNRHAWRGQWRRRNNANYTYDTTAMPYCETDAQRLMALALQLADIADALAALAVYRECGL